MRGWLIAISPMVLALLVLAAGFLVPGYAVAAGQPETGRGTGTNAAEISGVYLTTAFPGLSVRAGETATLDLSLHNYRLPPQQLTLSVTQAPTGWKATILGGGQPVASAIVGPGEEQRLQLRLEPPSGAGPGDYRFVVTAHGASGTLALPITLTIGKELPAKLKLSTGFPALRGTASTSFKFTVTVENDSGRDATINLSASAPKAFEVTFAEAYGSQQITSIPIGAGKSKDIDMSVSLPRDTPAGDYKLLMHAKGEAASANLPLAITVFGQPRLALAGEGGRLSGEAYAGKASPLNLVVRNDGSEAARDIEISATAPDGWKTSFEPKEVPLLAAGKSQSVQVTLTPSAQAIAGDYQTTIRASAADGASESADFRITVLTSTLWGMAGIGVIAVALLVVVFAVARYGRR
jgi:uncharacterized membrane protein